MRGVIDHRQLEALTTEEAAALMAARMRDPVGAEDRLVLEEWLDSDEANREAWSKAQAAFEAFDDSDDDAVLQALRAEARDAGPSTSLWRGGLVAVAAVLALLFLGTLAWRSGVLPAGTRPHVSVAQSGGKPGQILRTAKGQIRRTILPDGSHMTLDADSVIAVAFSPQRRDLRLIGGRAYFDVEHDTGRPFVVRAGTHDVVAVGTRFEVSVDSSGLSVLLVEGRVKVVASGDGATSLFLDPGQRLVMEKGEQPRVTAIDPANAEQWQNGMLTFRNEELSSVVATMNRYSGERLIIRDGRVGALRVTGTFRAGDSARFGRAIAAIHPVRLVRAGRDWEIRWAGKR